MQARRVLTGCPGRSTETVADCGPRWVERGAADPLARALTCRWLLSSNKATKRRCRRIDARKTAPRPSLMKLFKLLAHGWAVELRAAQQMLTQVPRLKSS
jgi:hypothetical protein